VIGSLLAAAFLIRIFSRGKSTLGAPPIVPYWIPWLGSAISLGRDPDGFLKKAQEQLGPIFRIKTAGHELTYVVSPSLIASVYRDPKTFQYQPIRLEHGHKILQIPRDVCYSPMLNDRVLRTHFQMLAPQNIHTLLERYTYILHDRLVGAISSSAKSGMLLRDFITPLAYTSAANAMFGETFPAAKTYDGFRRFNEGFHLLAAGVVPEFMVAKPIRAWDGVLGIIEGFVKDLRVRGIPPVALADLYLSAQEEAGWSDHGIASLLGADLFAISANTLGAIYWTIAFILRDPNTLRSIISEIDHARNGWISSHPDIPLSSTTFAQFMQDIKDELPLLTSAIQEMLRCCTSTFSIRQVSEPVEFAGYQLSQGDRMICATRAVHMDEGIYERPFEFLPDRFLDSRKKFSKDGKLVQNPHMPFGGGTSMCEGRHLAVAEVKTFVTILFTYATIEVIPGATWPELCMERIGTGIIHPRGDIRVIVKSNLK